MLLSQIKTEAGALRPKWSKDSRDPEVLGAAKEEGWDGGQVGAVQAKDAGAEGQLGTDQSVEAGCIKRVRKSCYLGGTFAKRGNQSRQVVREFVFDSCKSRWRGKRDEAIRKEVRGGN